MTPTIVWFAFGNIGSQPIAIVLMSDGSLLQVNTLTSVAVFIASPGTFLNPSPISIAISQWGSQYIIIVANQTNGYWLWDGVNFFGSGTLGPDVTIFNSGLDYTSQPTITAFGGAGSGGTFQATLQNQFIQQISVTNPGSGYLATDAAILAFNGGGSPGRTAKVLGVISAGTIASVSIVDGGAGYTSSATGAFLGGGGANAQVSVVTAGGAVTGVSFISRGVGYVTPPVLLVLDPNNPVAQADIDLMPFGVQGNAVETFQSRVWIANGAEIEFTAPGSVVDFATSDGGGAFRSVDSFLRVGFINLKQSNGFLYLIGDSSINYISGVQTSGNPPVTTFTNQNADPEIGTPYPNSVEVFSRNILLANAFGVHVSYGGAVTKISDNLDGVYTTVPNFGNLQLSSAKAIIFGIKCWMVLVPVIDQITNQQINKLFLWDGRRWFSSQQDMDLIFINVQEINSVLTAYGTDGIVIRPLFQKPAGFTKSVRSKLFSKPGDPAGYMFTKAATRLWGLAYYYDLTNPTLNVSVDNEVTNSVTPVIIGPVIVVIINIFNQPVTVLNAVGRPITVVQSGVGIVVFPPQAVAQQGALTGLTVQTTAFDMAIISMAFQDEIADYRG